MYTYVRPNTHTQLITTLTKDLPHKPHAMPEYLRAFPVDHEPRNRIRNHGAITLPGKKSLICQPNVKHRHHKKSVLSLVGILLLIYIWNPADQLRLVVHEIIYMQGFIHPPPGGDRQFLNHQQYQKWLLSKPLRYRYWSLQSEGYIFGYASSTTRTWRDLLPTKDEHIFSTNASGTGCTQGWCTSNKYILYIHT